MEGARVFIEKDVVEVGVVDVAGNNGADDGTDGIWSGKVPFVALGMGITTVEDSVGTDGVAVEFKLDVAEVNIEALLV